MRVRTVRLRDSHLDILQHVESQMANSDQVSDSDDERVGQIFGKPLT